MAARIEVAILAASQLNMDTYGWTITRGKSRTDEPLYGFAVYSAAGGVTTNYDPLVLVEHDDPLTCVQSGIAKLMASLGEPPNGYTQTENVKS